MKSINPEILFANFQVEMSHVKKFCTSSEVWSRGNCFVAGPKGGYKKITVTLVDDRDSDEFAIAIFEETPETIAKSLATDASGFFQYRPAVNYFLKKTIVGKPVSKGAAIMWAYEEWKTRDDGDLLEEGYM